MSKHARWIDQCIRVIYVSIMVLAFFDALNMFIPRIYFFNLKVSTLPDWSIFWLLIVVGAYALTIPYVDRKRQSLCFLLFFLIGVFSGYFLIHDLALSIFLILVLSFMTYRAVVNEIRVEELTSLWMIIILFYTFILIIINGFGMITEEEIQQFFKLLAITFILYLLGLSLLQLHHVDPQKSERELLKPWKQLNLWLWGSIFVFIVASIFILFVAIFGYGIFRWIIIAALTPVAKFTLTDFFGLYDWIGSMIAKFLGRSNEEDIQETSDAGEEDFNVEKTTALTENPVYEIGLAIVFIILLFVIINMIIRFIKRKSLKKINTTVEKSQSLLTETIHQDERPKDWIGLKQMMKNLFPTREPDTPHEVRKEFQQLLKILREKGYYESDSMTVQQINKNLQGLNIPAHLYERLRYGDQNLTDEEIRLFKIEIQKIKKDLVK